MRDHEVVEVILRSASEAAEEILRKLRAKKLLIDLGPNENKRLAVAVEQIILDKMDGLF